MEKQKYLNVQLMRNQLVLDLSSVIERINSNPSFPTDGPELRMIFERLQEAICVIGQIPIELFGEIMDSTKTKTEFHEPIKEWADSIEPFGGWDDDPMSQQEYPIGWGG